MALSNILWWGVVALGPLILAIAYIYVFLRRRTLEPQERTNRDRETDRIYEENEAS